MMMINSLAAMPINKLKRAVEIREQIDGLMMELEKLMPGSGFIANGTERSNGVNGKAHNGSANGYRWTMGSSMADGKPRLSADGRAKVSAAVKARWERYRAAKARMARSK
jgi:hypothetical protein